MSTVYKYVCVCVCVCVHVLYESVHAGQMVQNEFVQMCVDITFAQFHFALLYKPLFSRTVIFAVLD